MTETEEKVDEEEGFGLEGFGCFGTPYVKSVW